ncbi:MAG: insulinase family protein, partial [Prevotellaceae bacterium]|nr:insulinase family protein [Prevotellaceae bacterium]
LTPETKILLAPYDAKQIYMAQLSNNGEKYNSDFEPIRQLYNEYFGGGMNSIVFQEMRESRGLAYSAQASYLRPAYLKYPYTFRTQIATQNDKMIDAIKAFNDIINNMPESENAFNLAKEGFITRLRTERITKSNVLWEFVDAQDLGENTDVRAKVFKDVQGMTLKDVTDFQKKWVKNRTYTYMILGDKKELNMTELKKIAPVIELKTEEIFGY